MTFCIYQLSLFETAMLKRFNMQDAVPPLPHSLPLLKATQFNHRCNQPEYTVHPRHDIAFAHSIPVFSTFYSFIRLFANKRIEYEVGSNKVLFLFVNTNKGALIRLFDYSQLKNKGEAANKSTPFCVFTRNGLCRISIEY